MYIYILYIMCMYIHSFIRCIKGSPLLRMHRSLIRRVAKVKLGRASWMKNFTTGLDSPRAIVHQLGWRCKLLELRESIDQGRHHVQKSNLP